MKITTTVIVAGLLLGGCYNTSHGACISFNGGESCWDDTEGDPEPLDVGIPGTGGGEGDYSPCQLISVFEGVDLEGLGGDSTPAWSYVGAPEASVTPQFSAAGIFYGWDITPMWSSESVDLNMVDGELWLEHYNPGQILWMHIVGDLTAEMRGASFDGPPTTMATTKSLGLDGSSHIVWGPAPAGDVVYWHFTGTGTVRGSTSKNHPAVVGAGPSPSNLHDVQETSVTLEVVKWRSHGSSCAPIASADSTG